MPEKMGSNILNQNAKQSEKPSNARPSFVSQLQNDQNYLMGLSRRADELSDAELARVVAMENQANATLHANPTVEEKQLALSVKTLCRMLSSKG